MKTSRKILLSLIALLAVAFIAGVFNLDPVVGSLFTTIAVAPIIAGIKDSQELSEEKRSVWAKAEAIVALVKEEKRDRTDEETTKYDGYLARMKVLDKEIQRAKDHEARVAEMAGASHRETEDKRNKETRSFSFLRAVEIAKGNQPLDGIEREMDQEAKKEAREAGVNVRGVAIPSFVGVEKRSYSVTADSGTKGGANVQTTVVGFIDALLDKYLLQVLGVDFMTGLIGDLKMPRDGAVVATWEGEVDTAAETDNEMDSISLSPNRLAAKLLYSHQMANQIGNFSVEQRFRMKLIEAVRLKLQATFINGSGSGSIPTGLLNYSGIGSVPGGTNGLAPTRDHLKKLLKEIKGDNADTGNIKFLTNSAVEYKLGNTPIVSGSDIFVWPDNVNKLVGHDAFVTNAVPSTLTKGDSTGVCSAIIAGDFTKSMIGQWGGISVLFDPYTKADTAQDRLIVDSYWDIDFERPEFFAAMKDALTT